MTGTGTAADPFKVVTVVDLAATGLRITQTDSYVIGDENYRTDIAVTNSSSGAVDATLYHAGDCFLQDSDDGFGFTDSSNGAIYCTKNANNNPPDRIEGFAPLSPGSHYMEAEYSHGLERDRRGRNSVPRHVRAARTSSTTVPA